jgi:hypothetical protein
MKTTTVVNGFEITENVSEVLGNWAEVNYPRMYVENLSELQDFLCRILLLEAQYDDQVKVLLGNLICLKDDMKKFVKEN